MTWKRVATAAVLIPAVLFFVSGGSVLFALALALVSLLALFEFFSLGDAIGHRAYRFWTGTCALALIYVQWLATIPTYTFDSMPGWDTQHRNLWNLRGGPPGVADVFFVFVIGIALITLWTKRSLVEALPAAGISASGLILVAFPLSYAIRFHGGELLGRLLLLFALVITWAGDTSAYFVGRWVGKHPIAPHLSPKKTWEGAAASLIAALLVGAIFPRFAEAVFEKLLAAPILLPPMFGMAVVGNIAGQAGDLLESAYKRSAGVKDSGSLLPGHGGVLDRIDALILAIPVVWYYWIWIYLPNR
jgi:phosphatidate cytidylyltransferase